MTWITDENNRKFWMPEELPEKSLEYNKSQAEKQYLTTYNTERFHPKWHYDNGALVDDDYLYYNEGWKLIIDDQRPVSLPKDLKKITQNPTEEWENVDEKTVRVTFTVSDITDEEKINYLNEMWVNLRNRRNELLLNTDYFFAMSIERGINVSHELKDYRQQLRDFPSSITDILDFDLNDDSLWPKEPTVFFEE
jgi:hypothetical protein